MGFQYNISSITPEAIVISPSATSRRAMRPIDFIFLNNSRHTFVSSFIVMIAVSEVLSFLGFFFFMFPVFESRIESRLNILPGVLLEKACTSISYPLVIGYLRSNTKTFALNFLT